MKVLIVTHDSNFSGGANRSLFANIRYLKDQYGVEFLVLLPSAKGQLNKKLDEISVPWIHTRYFGVMSGLRHDGKDWIRKKKVFLGYYIEKFKAKRVYKKLKDQGIDLVYTNTRLPMIGANIAKLLNVPHVVHVREFGTVEPLWGRWNFKTIYEMSDRIILISKALKKQFTDNGVPEDKLIVSHNGISYDSVPYREDPVSAKKDIHLILTGRLVPDKGHKDAIYALDRIISKHQSDKNIILHFVGSSPKRTHIEWYEQEIRELVKKLGLESNIIFEGETQDMPKMREQMDIELICSICETFGRVTVEGMRAGLLVIGSNTGGTPEIIQDGINGYLYKQGDPDDLADKILMALSDEVQFNKVRKNAFELSESSFTVETNCKDIYKVLSETACKVKNK